MAYLKLNKYVIGTLFLMILPFWVVFKIYGTVGVWNVE
jgi:hypothetical protein